MKPAGLPERVDLSRTLDVPGLRHEPCACGATLVAVNAPEAIRQAVEVHNSSAIHIAWELRMGYAGRVSRG